MVHYKSSPMILYNFHSKIMQFYYRVVFTLIVYFIIELHYNRVKYKEISFYSKYRVKKYSFISHCIIRAILL